MNIDVAMGLEIICCCKCQIPFGILASLLVKRRSGGGEFFCPSGHGQVFTEPREKVLERQRDEARTSLIASRERVAELERELRRRPVKRRSPAKKPG